ncbi:hypothetical protein FJ364_00705 [Candidatus Dependentiae bacterium]|nr:hypothetical protein [Candidatus Dependentiae bacterium]
MGVVSILNRLSIKKPIKDRLIKEIDSVERALTIVFRDIACEKNQMLYPAFISTLSHTEHQAMIIASAKELMQHLHALIFTTQTQSSTTELQDLAQAATSLEKFISDYEQNDQVLSHVLLACSSIKINLEKFRSNL